NTIPRLGVGRAPPVLNPGVSRIQRRCYLTVRCWWPAVLALTQARNSTNWRQNSSTFNSALQSKVTPINLLDERRSSTPSHVRCRDFKFMGINNTRFCVTYSFLPKFLRGTGFCPKPGLTFCSVFRQTALDKARNRLQTAV